MDVQPILHLGILIRYVVPNRIGPSSGVSSRYAKSRQIAFVYFTSACGCETHGLNLSLSYVLVVEPPTVRNGGLSMAAPFLSGWGRAPSLAYLVIRGKRDSTS